MPDEIKKGWYVDSAPGNSYATFKCGEIKASTGISGYTHITTPPPPPPPDIPSTAPADIDDHRATLAPGTRLTLPLTGNIAALATVWFDRESALYNLPKAPDSDSFSLSFWYNPWSEDGSYDGGNSPGRLFGSPSVPLCDGTDPDNATAGCQPGAPTMTVNGVTQVMGGYKYFDIATLVNEAIYQGNGGELEIKTPASDHYAVATWSKKGWQNYSTSPVDEMQGWCHIMVALQRSGTSVLATVAINDLVLMNAQDIGEIAGSFPFQSLSDFTGPNGKDHFWNIGGKPDRLGGGRGCCVYQDYTIDGPFLEYVNGAGRNCQSGCQIGPFSDPENPGHNKKYSSSLDILNDPDAHLVAAGGSAGSWPGNMGHGCEGVHPKTNCQECTTECWGGYGPYLANFPNGWCTAMHSCAQYIAPDDTTGGCPKNTTWGYVPPCGGQYCGGCSGSPCSCNQNPPANQWCVCCPGTPCGPGTAWHTSEPLWFDFGGGWAWDGVTGCPPPGQKAVKMVVYCSSGDPNDDGFQPTDKDGYNGGVTELWIAPGQFVDWSNKVNRYRFHTSDDPYNPGLGTGGDSATVWSPIDLGKDGKGVKNDADEQISGTGTKPLIYLTGPPAYFNYNRAKNKAQLQLYRNSSGGVVGELNAYFSVPTQFV